MGRCEVNVTRPLKKTAQETFQRGYLSREVKVETSSYFVQGRVVSNQRVWKKFNVSMRKKERIFMSVYVYKWWGYAERL